MEICIECLFDSKPEFEKAKEYLGTTLGHGIYTSTDEPNEYPEGTYWVKDYGPITQDQLNELTALCPVKPRRKITKEGVYSKIAYMIGVFGAGYHPEDDMLDHIDYEDPMREKLQAIQNDIDSGCEALGLDPCAIALEVLTDLGMNPVKD